MSDELTPEERKALDSLPRERMPAGLEERVVGAMREHGFLARRRRTIVLTNTRVAGLLAACVALVIGAYSIGLQRGDGSEVLLLETPKMDDEGRMDRPFVATPEEKAAPLAESKAPEAEQVVPATPARPAEAATDHIAAGKTRQEGLAKDERDVAKSVMEMPAPAAAANESAARSLAVRDNAASGTLNRPRTFQLNGTPVIVEAPDSVRVVQDDQGRVLIIYTSDGIIRIRLGNDD